MFNILEKISVRNFNLAIFGIALITMTAVISYVLWPQLKSYQTSKTDLAELEKLVSSNSDIQYEISSLNNNIEQSKRKLQGDMAGLPDKEMEAYIIGVLQNISWDKEVNLVGVKPVKGREINIFQEILFQVKLSGDYFDLYDWFIELRNQLGFIVIKKLDLTPKRSSDDANQLMMDLTIASYKGVER